LSVFRFFSAVDFVLTSLEAQSGAPWMGLLPVALVLLLDADAAAVHRRRMNLRMVAELPGSALDRKDHRRHRMAARFALSRSTNALVAGRLIVPPVASSRTA
jgi:hypothetical protein